MTYVDPENVVSPRSRWGKGHQVLCNTGQGGWSLSEGSWDDNPALAIRWNGSDSEPGIGNPSSHSNPTWFIVPGDLHHAMRETASKISNIQSHIDYKTWRPEDYDWGAFEIEIGISEKAQRILRGHDLVFFVPNLRDRFFHIYKQYKVAPLVESKLWRGKFIDGVWRTIVQTNGVPEDENVTKPDAVRDALIASVTSSIMPFFDLNDDLKDIS